MVYILLAICWIPNVLCREEVEWGEDEKSKKELQRLDVLSHRTMSLFFTLHLALFGSVLQFDLHNMKLPIH